MTLNSVRTMVFAAAAMTFSAAGSFAQDRLVADINFNFKSSTADLPAGKYEVLMSKSSGAPLFHLRNIRTSKSVLIAGTVRLSNAKREDPRMVFRCNGSGCGLTEIWMGGNDAGFQTQRPHLSPGQQERIAVVRMSRSTHAD